MAVTRRTLLLLHQLMVQVGSDADTAVRDLTGAWLTAWNELSPSWSAAIVELMALAAADGRWPPPWRMARAARLSTALTLTSRALAELTDNTNNTLAGSATSIVGVSTSAQAAIMAAQLPATAADEAANRYAARIPKTALQAILARTTGRVHALTHPLSDHAIRAMKRALTDGVTVNAHPNKAAADMLNRMQCAFNGGLLRATTIARTELLDAHRTAAAATQHANADVLAGWIWNCALDIRSCAACWSMHGSEHPLDEPGPDGHQSCRCTRLPLMKPWRELGIDTSEPDSATPDGREQFDALPDTAQLQIMGPGRLALLKADRIDWSDLPVRRETPGWRASYVPRPVADLTRLARPAA